MRANEYLNILQENFDWKVRIESLETQTEWDTTWYEIVAYIPKLIIEDLKKAGRDEDISEFEKGDSALVMDVDSIAIGETMDEAVETLFHYCFDKGLLK